MYFILNNRERREKTEKTWSLIVVYYVKTVHTKIPKIHAKENSASEKTRENNFVKLYFILNNRERRENPEKPWSLIIVYYVKKQALPPQIQLYEL